MSFRFVSRTKWLFHKKVQLLQLVLDDDDDDDDNVDNVDNLDYSMIRG